MNTWKTPNGKVTLNRSTEGEIDQAISDLEKRGFVLIEKRQQDKGFEEYNKHSRRQGTVFAKRWVAEMRREDEGNERTERTT